MCPFFFCMNLIVIQIVFFKPPCVQTISPTTAFEIFRLKNEMKNIAFRAGA